MHRRNQLGKSISQVRSNQPELNKHSRAAVGDIDELQTLQKKTAILTCPKRIVMSKCTHASVAGLMNSRRKQRELRGATERCTSRVVNICDGARQHRILSVPVGERGRRVTGLDRLHRCGEETGDDVGEGVLHRPRRWCANGRNEVGEGDPVCN